MDSRLASGRRPDHGDGDPPRVEEAARHGAVKLCRSHVLVLGNIVDAINEGGALATISRRVGRDLCRSARGVRRAIQGYDLAVM
jgi:hypothetical protein